jgi:hypothetical protein
MVEKDERLRLGNQDRGRANWRLASLLRSRLREVLIA